MVQHRSRHAQPAAAAAAPRHPGTRHPGATVGRVRRGADRTGNVRRTVHRHSRGGTGDLPHLEADAAGTRHRTGEGARHAGENLLQERERLARRLAQAQHGRTAGLLQLQAGHPPPHDRDGRRTMGFGHRLRGTALRHRRRGLHGPRELRPETLPAADDADLGREVLPLALGPHRLGPRRAGEGPGLLGQPRTGDLGGRGDGAATPRRHALLPGQRTEPRATAPDRHRPTPSRTW